MTACNDCRHRLDSLPRDWHALDHNERRAVAVFRMNCTRVPDDEKPCIRPADELDRFCDWAQRRGDLDAVSAILAFQRQGDLDRFEEWLHWRQRAALERHGWQQRYEYVSRAVQAVLDYRRERGQP